MQLHGFFNSSTSYRVRIALALKGIAAEHVGVDIRAGAHRDPSYIAEVNAGAAVPAIVFGTEMHGMALGQSLAIIDALDALQPEPRLIPDEPGARARVLELSCLIACDTHPLNNLRVLRYLKDELGLTAAQQQAWYTRWIADGMASVERLLERYGHPPWCFGAAPTLADCCLVPQMANAARMGCDLSIYPAALRVQAHAATHPAFLAAAPERQPDFVR